jgi:hypothetical protein
VSRWVAPVLVLLSVFLLARSFYSLYVQRRGTRFSKMVAWVSALFVVGFWTWRLLPG